ncbi:MAG TPA: hypothetical protein VFA21_20355 [Pyrinomonadaceae bacterium]|jgi:hypothetical protein|nr:hypothetical protein [Pyrinomonadaceae bacterium]
MPIDYSRYPKHWHAFSEQIRFERAQNRCEWCGAENHKPHPDTASKVVLTVAHLDGKGDVCKCEEEDGSKCAKPEHVAALCQRCHLTYDVERHKFNARRTRAARAGQMWLGDIEHRFERQGQGK